MSLLFTMWFRLVIAFLLKSKCLLISWLQSPSEVIFGVQENKISHWFHCFPIFLPWRDGPGCHDLTFLNVEFLASFFTLLFYFHQDAPQLLFVFCHKVCVICLSEVIDISPSNVAMPIANCLKTVPRTPEGHDSRLVTMKHFLLPLSAKGRSQKQMTDPSIIFLVAFPITSLCTKFIPAFQLTEPSLLA